MTKQDSNCDFRVLSNDVFLTDNVMYVACILSFNLWGHAIAFLHRIERKKLSEVSGSHRDVLNCNER